MQVRFKCRHGALGEGIFLLSTIPGGSALATALAGFLTYGSNDAHTFPHLRAVVPHLSAVVYVSFSPLTAAGTVVGFTPISLNQRRKPYP